GGEAVVRKIEQRSVKKGLANRGKRGGERGGESGGQGRKKGLCKCATGDGALGRYSRQNREGAVCGDWEKSRSLAARCYHSAGREGMLQCRAGLSRRTMRLSSDRGRLAVGRASVWRKQG